MEHGLMLFDEAGPAQVIANKKVFKALSVPIGDNQSATSCHARRVFVGGKKLVISTNNWKEDLAKMSEADASWLRENSYLQRVKRPMWVDDVEEYLPTTQP